MVKYETFNLCYKGSNPLDLKKKGIASFFLYLNTSCKVKIKTNKCFSIRNTRIFLYFIVMYII